MSISPNQSPLQVARLGAFTLASGATLPELEVAYVAHGTLVPDGRNAILVTHGFTSGPSMLSAGHHTAEGSWAPLMGPGRPLDTSRYYVVCSNMLGSSFGSTGPRTLNPSTGRPWGPDFPRITLTDIVGAQHRLLQHLGVKRLHAVLGPSYGGWQALQWALDQPAMVGAIGVFMSGLTHPPGISADAQRARFAQCPHWHGGWHYDDPGMVEELFKLRLETLRSYGLERLYEDRLGSSAERQAALEKSSRGWAQRFDPNSMVALAGAAENFDVRDRIDDIRARMLFVVCTTDAIFPPDSRVTELVTRRPQGRRYLELDSPYGHMASGVEWRRLEPELNWLIHHADAQQT
ncbi:homoserine O-acetyltransferase [Variovorax sp. HW608]|uniref:alpha/beta fold hydrolase n=1 Tax=Variovorax sp. HW608 TaxID=1034889 RepID=UPI00081F7F28|nr:alpha/beta fold hydrolase [Variovorax sp. HW608]SCK09890.1 homoserine O-acetyltransferase [Variovorax sp. HW608]